MSKTMQKDVVLENESAPLPAMHPPVLALRLGRGRTGGSTMLDLMIQRARHAGRIIMICDGDRRNPTLATLYPPDQPGGASQPASDEGSDGKDWITDAIGAAMRGGSSLAIDMGAGDRVMQDFVRDLDLVEFCGAAGLQPLGLFSSGPDMEDFEHVCSIWNAGYFRPARSLLVLNEHLVPQGRTTLGAFDAIMAKPVFKQMAEAGMETIILPRLACMDVMRRAELGFIDAAAGLPGMDGVPLDPVRQFMVKQWLAKIEAKLDSVGAGAWLP